MPIAAIRLYLNRLPALQASLKIMLAEVAVVPHLPDEARRKLLRRWEREAAMYTEQSRPTSSVGALRMMGIGVKRVRARREPGASRP